MFKIVSFAVSLAILSAMSLPSYGQNTPTLNLKNSGSMGYVPTITKPITSNKTVDLGVQAVDLDPNRNLAMLGCGALDTHEARKAVLEVDTSNLNEYFDTSVSNFMVTTLFNSPAVAEIFNGLENFAGSRVRELQDRCAAMEYKDDLAPAQWASVQHCINSYAKDQASTDKKVMAMAFKACLSSPKYANQGSEVVNTNLFDAGQQVLESRKWNGTLFSALENTRACMDTTLGKSCDIFAFIPNLLWCTGTNKFDFDQCGAQDGDTPDKLTGPENGTDRTIISAEAISPMQVFDASFGFSEGFINYAMVYAYELVAKVSAVSATEIARVGENKYALLHAKNIATPSQVSTDDGSDAGPEALNKPKYFDLALGNFLNCTVDTEFGAPTWENFNKILDDGSASMDALISDMPEPLAGGVIYGDSFKPDLGVAHSLPSDSTISEFNVAAASNIVEMATKCAVRDELRLALTDYIGLLTNLRSKDAALLGYRTQVAYVATRNILNFIVHRLQLAKMDLAFNVSTDPNSPPPHVRLALDTIIDSFKSRIVEMEERRKQQRDYAAMIAKFQ